MERPRPSTVIRRARRADRNTLLDILARAFAADPVARYLLRQDGDRLRALKLSFGAFFDHVIMPAGEAYLAGAQGAALWSPPNRWDAGLLRGAAMLPSLARSVGLPRVFKAGRGAMAVQRRHPKEPHWYLFAIGVDPAHQGRGVGGALLRHVLERHELRSRPAYLEASTEGSSRLYERHGFRTTEVLHMAPDAPPLWLMWRAPPR